MPKSLTRDMATDREQSDCEERIGLPDWTCLELVGLSKRPPRIHFRIVSLRTRECSRRDFSVREDGYGLDSSVYCEAADRIFSSDGMQTADSCAHHDAGWVSNRNRRSRNPRRAWRCRLPIGNSGSRLLTRFSYIIYPLEEFTPP